VADLPVLNPHAAFVDVGSEQMHVSIAGGPPKVFGAVTSQLEALRDWLLEQGADAVAMEATGVYWLPLYGILEQAGLQLAMVNGRQTKNLPGRKTDIADCQWGATLHMHGLLKPGFVPTADIRRLQDFVRLRNDHIKEASSQVQKMQQALERMNIKLHDAISSITGVSGMRMVRAILAGERDPGRLLALCDAQIRHQKGEAVREALRGTWAAEHLFALRQAVQIWDQYQALIAECDQQIQAILPEPPKPQPPKRQGKRTRTRGNAFKIPLLRSILMQMCGGHDLTLLPAHTEYSVLQILSEVGTDLTKWPTEKHFTSWLGLAPGSRQSGKRRGNVRRSRNRAARYFCDIVRSMARSKDIALGAFYRRIKAHRGGLAANIATARKLAAWFWRAMVKGIDFVETGVRHYELKILESKQRAAQRLAIDLGYRLVPA